MGAYAALWLALAFLAGIGAARWLPALGYGWGLTAAGLALAYAGLRRWRRLKGWQGALLLMAAAALGAWRWQAVQPNFRDPAFIGAYAGWRAEAVVVGVLSEPPDVRDTYANLRLQVERLRFAGETSEQRAYGMLLVRASPALAAPLHYGDRLVVTGRLEAPPTGDAFSYRDYLARQGVFVTMKAVRLGVLARRAGSPILAAIYALRTRAHAVVRRLWPDPEASLLAGILLGLDKGIPREVYAAFRTTGTAHIIAISGFNITILAGVFLELFGRLLGESRGTAAAALAVLAYTVMVGGDAAVVRAAIMGILSMAALRLGRRQHAYTTLALTAAIMAALTPTVLGDVGFQLSFAATFGLVLLAQPFQDAAERFFRRWMPPARARRWAAPVGEFFLFTLAAQVLTLPISAYHFRQISIVSFLANPVVLPVQAPLMIGAGAATVLGLLWLPLGKPVAWAVWPLAAYTIRAVEAFAALPWAAVAVATFGIGGVVGYYAFLAAAVALWKRWASWWSRVHVALTATVILPLLAVGVLFVWQRAFSQPDGRLHVALLPVGNGASALVRTPAGRWVLIGGGERGTALAAAVGRALGPGQSLDWWVVGATDEENVSGLVHLLAPYPPRQVWWAGNVNASSAARALQARLQAAHIRIYNVQQGAALDLGSGARLRALEASPRGGVFLLQWRNFRLLLPLGMDFDSLKQLQGRTAALQPLAGLLLAEGGYAPLNPPETVRQFAPRVLLLSVRPADPYGRPSLELLQALRGFPLLRTDQCGWIALTTDGQQLWVRSQKPCPAP